ncbi:MAG: hypothetical protein H7Y88_02190 [Phycisphaerales bacterium]|nr:hypothetical protein [Phycisphaerales bacterium]
MQMFGPDELIESAAAALREHEITFRLEQSVTGLDALEETRLHPILHRGLAAAGFGVLREQPYPDEWRARRGESSLPRDRLRCDLLLTPHPGQRLRDPLHIAKRFTAARREIEGTLFEPLGFTAASGAQEPEPAAAASDTASPEDCLWLEAKLVAQFCYSAGIPGPNRTYAPELLRHIPADLAKLAKDSMIAQAGVLLIHFTADEATADHDMVQLMHRCLDKELPVESPRKARFAIADRIGNNLCTLWLIGVRK